MTVFPRKRFGQHWLKDESVLRGIVLAAKLKNTDHILEIGPGTGNLTRKLLPHVQQLTAVELDRDLCAQLRKEIQIASFHLIEADILSVPLPIDTNKVVANIPYNITGAILKKLLGTIGQPIKQFQTIVLLVQKEIAQRLTSPPGKRAYGALSVRSQYLAKCEWMIDVPARCFHPSPKVDSAVVRLTPCLPVLVSAHPQFLETIITLGFAQKRKMLRNNLQSIGGREIVCEILEKMELSSQVRAEDLSVQAWIHLSERLLAMGLSPIVSNLTNSQLYRSSDTVY